MVRTEAPANWPRTRTAVGRIQALSRVYGSSATATRWKVVSHSRSGRGAPASGVVTVSSEGVVTSHTVPIRAVRGRSVA